MLLLVINRKFSILTSKSCARAGQVPILELPRRFDCSSSRCWLMCCSRSASFPRYTTSLIPSTGFELLTRIDQRYCKQVGCNIIIWPFILALDNSFVQIVAATLFDQFHEVQKKACSVLVTMAQRDPEVFGNKTGVFLRGLVPCLNHAHSRVSLLLTCHCCCFFLLIIKD